MAYDILLGRSDTFLPPPSRKLDGVLLELGSLYNRSLQPLRQLQEQTNAPIIVIDEGDTEVAVQALKNGAADYLVKDRITPDDLCLAMRTAIENAELKHELQRSQERLELATRAANIGSWDWDVQTGEVRWSPSLERLFGMAPGSFDGCYETVRAMIHPEDLPRVEQALQRVLNDGEEYNIEFRFIKPDGTVRWALSLGKVFYDADGRPVRMAGVDRDISARKQAEARLRRSERRYRSLVEATTQIVWNTDGAQGEFVTEQPGWGNFTGQTFNELKGWGCLNAVHPDDRAKTSRAWLTALENQALYEVNHRLRRWDGVYRHMQVRAVPVLDDHGTILEWLGSHTDITDSQETAAALAANEARLRGFVEANVVGIAYSDINGIISAANDKLLSIIGYTQADVQAGRLRWADLTPPEYRSLDEQGIAEARAEGACTSYEKEYIRKDGRRIPVLVGYSLLGESQESVAFVLDLSDLKQAEQAMRASEERYAALAQISPVGIFRTDVTGDCLYVNDRWCQLAGLSPAAAKGKGWVRAIHPDDRDRVSAEWYRSATLDQPFHSEYRFRTPDGQVSWLIGQAIAEKNADGQVIGYIGTVTDISDRRQAQIRLQESEKHLQMGMQVSGFALAQIDYTTDTVHLSPEAATLYGFAADQRVVSRQQIHTRFHPDDLPELEHHMRSLFDPASSGWFAQDHRVVHPNGDVKWLTVRKQVFFDHSSPNRQPSYAVLVALDITARKQAEEERSHLLQKEQAARVEAEQANRIKDEFMAILSHELRSPLNPIMGWANLMQTRKLDAAKTAEAAAIIERNAKLQTQLIDDLLDVAKILRGKLAMEMVPVDLAFVIEAAIDTVRSAADAKSIRLNPVLPPVGQISGDSGRLQQVIWNLLSNAIKFTPNHGRVNITLEQIDNQAQITVSDTGKGIAPEFLPYLFESFRQEDATITRKHGGLGLGLAIVRFLVDAHQGTITANSPGEGQGATFTIHFPLLDIELGINPAKEKVASDLDLTGLRVLAVDDEPDARELLAAVLEMYGAEVLIVTSAAEVLTVLGPFRPDVLVSDIGMPDVDGYSLVQHIRSLPPEKGGQVPAIGLTAYAREEDQQRAITSGFQQQVTKPLHPEQLVQVVMTLGRGLG